MTQFTVSDFKRYVESMSIVYSSIYDRITTGFSDTVYTINPTSNSFTLAEIEINLVGDLTFSLMQQLTQLAKGVLSGGMSLIFDDDFATNNEYYCKWANAGDFVETNEVIGGGVLMLSVYKIIGIVATYSLPSGAVYVYDSEVLTLI